MERSVGRFGVVTALAMLSLAVTPLMPRSQEETPLPRYAGKVNAPEFPEGLDWLNTERPLSIFELRGKVVLLDFWTFCCINCMHILPDLARLEEKYADELVVIGVHSAKFTAERDADNIRQAIMRYEIRHPVVNDQRMEIWNAYGARAWPTVFLIDPTGKVIGYASGEGVYEPFDELIGNVIREFDAQGKLDRRRISFRLERTLAPQSPLFFPGKVLADGESGRLFVADSNHNRIVVASLADGNVELVIGGGEPGLADGDFETATFNHPQGMALDDRYLYVADTENHAIRRVDLDEGVVETLAGNGSQAMATGGGGGVGLETLLNSPWDLERVDGRLYIAMAGPHQLWVMDLESGWIGPYAGSGREARVDGTLAEAALAQPSGLTSDGKRLYFADSETSSIRAADLPSGDRVRTIVGLDLFEYGDVDGEGDEVRLQHPLGVVFYDGSLYVADTYNNKIKKIDPKHRTSRTALGTGEPGYRDGKTARFDEPGGVSIANGKLYIADTNNHVIRVADISSGEVSTFMFSNIGRLTQRPRTVVPPPAQTLDIQQLAAGPGRILIDVGLPKGHTLNPLAPTTVTLSLEAEGDSNGIRFDDGTTRRVIESPEFPLTIPVNAAAGSARILVEMRLYYCAEGEEALCRFEDTWISAPIEVAEAGGNATIRISHAVEKTR